MTQISMDELLRGFTETETEKVIANDNFLATFRAFPVFSHLFIHLFIHSINFFLSYEQTDGISCTTFNPKFPLLAMSSDRCSIRLFDISRNLVQPTLMQEFISHSGIVTAVESLDV